MWSVPLPEKLEHLRYYFTFLDFYHESLALISVCVSVVPISRYNQFLLFLLYYFIFLFLCIYSSVFVSLDEGFEMGIYVGTKVAIIVILFVLLLIYILAYYIYLIITGKRILISYLPFYMSIICSVVSLVFFYFAYFIYYWIFHSLWHIGIMLTTYFVLQIKEVEASDERRHRRVVSNVF